MSLRTMAGRALVTMMIGGAIAAACGGSKSAATSLGTTAGGASGGGGTPTGTHASSGSGGSGGGINLGNPGATVVSISITPAKASIESLNGKHVTESFQVVGLDMNGATSAITTGLSWSSDSPSVGTINQAGVFTANGSLGGVVNVSVAYANLKATTPLVVKLRETANPASATAAQQAALAKATTADANVVWSYPYDGTVWPRGLASPTLMWTGGAATDLYYVQLTSETFELDLITLAAPPAELMLDATVWQTFVDSTAGAAKLHVARFDGQTATVIANQSWTIAPQSMRGTIYYWANNLGRIMRIKPGSATPDDFSAGVVPSPGNGCTMACHTVSADGSTLIATGGTFGGSYDLAKNAPLYALGGTPDSAQIRQWALAAVTRDGKYVVADALSPQLTGLPIAGMFNSADGTAVPNATSGLSAELYYMPAFSPDGSSFVFVGDSNPNSMYWASTATAGPLKIFDFNAKATPMMSNERTLVEAGNDPTTNVIGYPSVSPDGRWVIYARMAWDDPTTQHNLTSYPPITSDLYLADAKNPGTEIRLATLNGDGYPFAAGARDLDLNFEPTFAPVAAGGYFWTVFLTRRTYGNILTGDRTTEKQLWVAAVDQDPKPGKDPSHAPFHLPGQDVTSLNLRGFWALAPCLANGQACETGTDCCGGFCETSVDGGAPTCKPAAAGCSNDGDHCTKTSQCCGAAAGTTCIGNVCSEPPPP